MLEIIYKIHLDNNFSKRKLKYCLNMIQRQSIFQFIVRKMKNEIKNLKIKIKNEI